VIGRGASSAVKIATDPRTGRLIAVKMIFPEDYDQEHFFREVEALMRLNHPCVCRILGWAPRGVENGAEIQMELAENGSLAHVLKQVRSGIAPSFWSATRKGIIICGIVLGMRVVHSKGYIHRDLKPGNILINGHGDALISDFGAVRPEKSNHTLTSECGTVHYAAPECWIDDANYTSKVDVFSFGSVLYEIVTENPAFQASMCPFDVLRQLRSGEMPAVPGFCGSFMQTLIHRCWSQDPDSRPSFRRIIKEFQHAELNILPGASGSDLRRYVDAILSEST
jgi:serine/threonine protein kinase